MPSDRNAIEHDRALAKAALRREGCEWEGEVELELDVPLGRVFGAKAKDGPGWLVSFHGAHAMVYREDWHERIRPAKLLHAYLLGDAHPAVRRGQLRAEALAPTDPGRKSRGNAERAPPKQQGGD